MQRFKNFIRNLHFPKVDNKTIFSSLVALILFIGLGVSVYLVQQNQEVRKKATGENLVTASFETVKTNIAPNETFDVKVKFTPDPTLKVTAASIIIKYDDTANPTNLLTLTNAQAGQFFLKDHNQTGRPTEMLNIIDTTTAGVAKISIGAPCAVCGPAPEFSCNPGMDCCTCYPQTSEDYYAVLTFKAKALGNATISIDGGSQAAAWGKDLTNVLYLPDPLPSLAINVAPIPTITPATTAGPLCGNGILDAGEVCDKTKNCITGKTSDGTDGLGCANACVGGSDGYHGYPNSGRSMYCKEDCSGYEGIDEGTDACWNQCTDNPANAEIRWGKGGLGVGDTCPTGGTINDLCVCVTIPTNTPVPTNTPMPTPTSTPKPTPTPIPTEPPVPTPTSIPNTSNLLLQLKLEGINKQSTNKNFLVTLFDTQTQNKIQETIRFISGSAGVYTGGIYNIPGGTYKIYAKGPYHLQKLLGEITFSTADGDQTLTKDYTATFLLRGDTTGDNQISIADIGGIISAWITTDTPVNANNANYDVEEDGKINIADIGAVISNWTQDVVSGDKLPNE